MASTWKRDCRKSKGQFATHIMEAAVLIPLVLLIVSEVLPYLPRFKGNGILQEIIAVLQKAYPAKRTLK